MGMAWSVTLSYFGRRKADKVDSPPLGRLVPLPSRDIRLFPGNNLFPCATDIPRPTLRLLPRLLSGIPGRRVPWRGSGPAGGCFQSPRNQQRVLRGGSLGSARFRSQAEHMAHGQSDDFVCEECGSLPTCEHDEIEGIEPRYESAKVPSTTSPETIAIAGRLSHLPLEIIRSLFDPAQNTLDLTVKTPFVSGQEVFNTYGEGMGWAKQAVEWGFVDASIEGDGALGRGLRWDLGDVLDYDSEDYGRAKKAWKKLCEARHENDQQDPQAEIGTDSTGNQDLETDSLFFAPPSNAPAKDNLLLNEDGQISYPLFWALVCGLHPALKDSSTAPNKVDILARRAQRSVDGRTDVSDGEAGEAVIGRLARHVVALFERRIARTSHPIKTAAELCDMLDEASPSSSTLFLLDSF